VKSSHTCAPGPRSKGIAKRFFRTSFVEGLLSKVKWWVTCCPVLDRNGVIRLGVGIGNLKSFVAGEAYLSLELLTPYGYLSTHEVLERVDALTRQGVHQVRLSLVQITSLLLVPSLAFLGYHLSEAPKGGFFSPHSYLLLGSPLYVNWRENTSACRHFWGHGEVNVIHFG